MREPTFRLTADGGITITRGSLEKIALDIAGQHDGRRYVRRSDDPLTVMEIDVARKTYSLTHAGTPVADNGWWANWPTPFWRQLCRMIPALPPPTSEEDTPT